MVALPTVEIPGLREAQRHEQELRDLPFLDIPEAIAGIPVRAFTLRDLVALDAMKNAHVVPFIFESELERVVQAMQFVWFMSTARRVPTSWLGRFWMSGRQARFVRRVSRMNSAVVFDGIKAYLADAWYDNPYGGSGESSAVLKASFVVYIVDHFYAAGYPWTEADILDMPVKRLWQYVRVSGKRLDPQSPLVNPSDRIANAFIAQRNAAKAADKAKGVAHA